MAIKTVGPVTDPTNSQFEIVPEKDVYDVAGAYALLANVPMPAVVTEEDLANE